MGSAVADPTACIRETAGTSPAAQISEARKLLDSGTITAGAFDQLEAEVLA